MLSRGTKDRRVVTCQLKLALYELKMKAVLKSHDSPGNIRCVTVGEQLSNQIS